jgi:dipeptidyl aminopeptidase/acylaminoacyl peptidase
MRQHSLLTSLSICFSLCLVLRPVASAQLDNVGATRGEEICGSTTVLSEMRSFYPLPISASPDGNRILARAKPEESNANGLVIIDTQTKQITKKLNWPNPMIHMLWRPDGHSISFFSQETETNVRHLIIWNLDDGGTREVPIPTTFAQPHVVWSPDGSRLAFGQETKAVVIVSATVRGDPVIYPGKFSIFAWSSDSESLVLVPDNDSHQVLIVDAPTVHLAKRFTTRNSGKVVDIAWQPRKDMLVLLQQENGSRSLVEVNPSTGEESVLLTSKSDIRTPVWLPVGKGYVFQRLEDGSGGLYIGPERKGPLPQRVDLDGITDYRGILSNENAIVVAHRSTGPMELLKVSLGGKTREVLASADFSVLPAVSPDQVFISSSDGLQIPILVWHSPYRNSGSAAVVVRAHGNIHGAEVPVWQEEIQMYLKHGVDFIGVNYRGSSGYGTEFEKAGNDRDRSLDIAAACEYAHSILGITYERIVLLGHSDGATLAVGAGLLEPRRIGTLAIVSLPALPRAWQTYKSADYRQMQLLDFHGSNDRLVSPAIGLGLIQEAFGRDILSPLNKHWFVLAGEDHVLHLDNSWAIVHSMILRRLGLIFCEEHVELTGHSIRPRSTD